MGKKGPMRQLWEKLNYAIRSISQSRVSATLSLLRPRKIGVELRRLGPRHDGGYLVPDDLTGIVGCVSPGVSTECGFDLEVANLGIPVLLADASVDGPPVDHSNFKFIKFFVDTSSTATSKTMEEMVALLPAGDDLLLQMDIEGAEYRVIDSMPADILQRFRILVIEFHALPKMMRRSRAHLLERVLLKLNAGHYVAHTHINNAQPSARVSGVEVPPLIEVTYYRKDRVRGAKKDFASLPHALDSDNLSIHPPAVYPEWLRGPVAAQP